MRENQADFAVRSMCRALGLSPSGYAWLKRPPSARSVADEELLSEIKQIHTFSRSTYGPPRIHPKLWDEGRQVCQKRVARLMRPVHLIEMLAGLRCGAAGSSGESVAGPHWVADCEESAIRSAKRVCFVGSAALLPTLSEADLSWKVGPRLNSAGRVGEASDALRLMLADDPT